MAFVSHVIAVQIKYKQLLNHYIFRTVFTIYTQIFIESVSILF